MAIAQGQFTLTEVNDGSNGAGVVKIDNYYYASSSDTPVPSTANGKWKTNISNLTDKYGKSFPYLWNYEVTTLENGSTLSTSPELISHYGTDGRGIHEVKEYYLRSSSSSGIKKPTSEPTSIPDSGISNNIWYSEPVATTSTYKYLWNCEKIVYTDGTNGGYTTPAIIGTHGSPGDPGDPGTVQGTKLFYSATASDITAPDVDLTSSKTSFDVEGGQIAFNTTTWYSEAKFFGVKNPTDSTKYGAWDIRQSADVCRPGYAPCVWKIELILSQADGKWYCAYSPQKVSLLEAATIAAQIQATESKETNNLAFWCKKARLSIIDGSTIVAGSIDADRLSVNSLSAINANLGTVKAGTIQSSNYNNVNEILICSSGLAFTLNSDGTTYSVSGIGSCDQTDIIIPATHNYLPVTSVAENAFWLNTSLTSVVIPGSVISIGKDAFDGCFNLESVVIPDSVTSIGDKAFYSCKGLSSVTIPNSVEDIGDYAFAFCDGLTHVDLPDGVISIGSSAFRECNKLTSIVIPDSVTSIGQYAFYKCSRLTSVAIGESLISIGDSVFANCTGLKNIILPNSVTNIVDYAFSKCNSLISVYYTGTINDWSQIDIKTGNETLTNATIYYSSTTDEVPSSPSWYNMEKNRLKISLDNGTIDSKYFKLASDGTIRAENADISGKIKATSGSIGGWRIGLDSLTNYSGTQDSDGSYPNSFCMQVKTETNGAVNAMAIGKCSEQTWHNAAFRVTTSGEMYAVKGKIGSCKFHETRYPVVNKDLANIVGYGLSGYWDGLKYIKQLQYRVRYSPADNYSIKTFKQYSSLNNTTIKDDYAYYWKYGWTNSSKTPPSTWKEQYSFDSMDTSVIETNPHLWLQCFITERISYDGERDVDTVVYYIGDFSGYLTTFDIGEGSLNIGKNIIVGKSSSIKFEDDNGRLSGTWYYGDAEIATKSWRGIKSNIEELDNRYSILFDEMRPVRFTYNNGQSNRYHTGIILDELKAAMDVANVDTSELAAYCISNEVTGEGGIRYSELIALCVNEIQKLKKRVEELENNTK